MYINRNLKMIKLEIILKDKKLILSSKFLKLKLPLPV